MENSKANLCEVCGTPLEPSSKHITFDGSLKMDGSSDMGGNVCPKCHPDLVVTENAE